MLREFISNDQGLDLRHKQNCPEPLVWSIFQVHSLVCILTWHKQICITFGVENFWCIWLHFALRFCSEKGNLQVHFNYEQLSFYNNKFTNFQLILVGYFAGQTDVFWFHIKHRSN